MTAAANRVTHKTIKIGDAYLHRLDGRDWTVKVAGIFEDRQRWGWEGTLYGTQNDVETGSKCWGWIDELREVSNGSH